MFRHGKFISNRLASSSARVRRRTKSETKRNHRQANVVPKRRNRKEKKKKASIREYIAVQFHFAFFFIFCCCLQNAEVEVRCACNGIKEVYFNRRRSNYEAKHIEENTKEISPLLINTLGTWPSIVESMSMRVCRRYGHHTATRFINIYMQCFQFIAQNFHFCPFVVVPSSAVSVCWSDQHVFNSFMLLLLAARRSGDGNLTFNCCNL